MHKEIWDPHRQARLETFGIGKSGTNSVGPSAFRVSPQNPLMPKARNFASVGREPTTS